MIPDRQSTRGKFIAAIAGSAGSHTRLLEFFDHTPHDEVSYVVLQHLPANWRSRLKGILARHTKLSIQEVRHGMVLHNDCIYVAPSADCVTIQNDVFSLVLRPAGIYKTGDIFMTSLAANSGHRAIGIVLEGTLDDGTRGLQSIHDAGGLTLAQDPATCRFSGMPQSAIDAGVVQRVAPIETMPGIIHNYVDNVIASPPIH
jgi:two-component system CheB/CheR fusion protein